MAYTNNSQNTYQSIIGYGVDPLNIGTGSGQARPSNYLSAYLQSKGIVDSTQQAKYLQSLGYSPTYDQGSKSFDINGWARQFLDANPSETANLFGKLGLNTDQAKLDLIHKGITPSSGVTAEMRQNNPEVDPQTINPSIPSTQTNSNSGTQATGFALTGSNLKYGSSGDDVKKLQQYLQGLGIYQGKVDGVFGPQTQASVQQFQTAHGLTADGIVGPKTTASLQQAQAGQGFQNTGNSTGNTQIGSGGANGGSGGAPTGTTFNTGNPQLDATLKALSDFAQAQQAKGLAINPALNLDQATIDRFLQTAKTQVHPYYQAQIDNIKSEVLRQAPQILQNYNSDIAGRQSSFQNSLGTARENFAGDGLAFSGQRTKDEQGMQDTQNRDLASLNQNYANQFYNLGNTAESKIGSSNSNFSFPSLQNYSANLAGNGGFTLGNSSSPYTAGNYGLGSLQYDENTAVQNRNQALQQTAAEDIRNGRSYQDLFA